MKIDINKIIEIIKDPDLKLKINDLYSENLKLKEENFELRKKLDKLRGNAKIQSKLIFKDNHYYLPYSEDKNEGPYCSKCWDADSKLIRLHTHNDCGVQHFECRNCKTNTSIGEYPPQTNFGGVEW